MTQPTAAESKLVDKLGNPQIANRLTTVSDANVAHSMSSFAEFRVAQDALGTTINAIITKLENHGLIDG